MRVGPGSHRGWRVIDMAGEIDVGHREGGWSAGIVADSAAAIGALRPHGVGLVEIGHLALLPRLLGC